MCKKQQCVITEGNIKTTKCVKESCEIELLLCDHTLLNKNKNRTAGTTRTKKLLFLLLTNVQNFKITFPNTI